MIVRVKGPGIKLQGQWCFKGKESLATQEEYEANKEYLEIVEEDEKPVVDDELEALKAEAKELGINVPANIKKETLIKKIAEAKQQ